MNRTQEKPESVRRRFTKRFLCCCCLQYSERLVKLEVDSLELHRIRFDVIYVCELSFGMVDLNFDDFFALSSCSTTRGHSYKLFLRYSRLNIRKHFSSERVVTACNNLECNVFKRFKMSLLSRDLSKYVHF